MELSSLLEQTLIEMDNAVVELAKLVPAPRLVPFVDSYVFRHVEKLPQQAIVQKLSRIPSSLRAAQLLCDYGFFQDQGALQRIIDELGEDAVFLALPLLFGPAEPIHSKFLDAFFAEEFDPNSGAPVAKQRDTPRRSKIRAYIARSQVGTGDPSAHLDVARTISNTYSGFVHSASPHIMETFGGLPRRFHTAGMLGTVREETYREDILNYYYRGFSAFVVSSKALGNEALFDRLHQFTGHYHAIGVGTAP
jgi:hypothetical protein